MHPHVQRAAEQKIPVQGNALPTARRSGVENDLIGVSRSWYKRMYGKTAEEMKPNI